MILVLFIFLLLSAPTLGMEKQRVQEDEFSSGSENERDLIAYNEKTGEYTLNLMSQNLRDDALVNLYSLTYSDTRFSQVTKLQDLNPLIINLGHNHLTRFPSNITCLRYLASLNLSNNELGADNPYCDLGHLPLTTTFTSLSIEKNQLSRFPPHITLPSLKGLYIFKNSINKLPLQISHMTSLTILDISNNKLKKLPSEFGYLVNVLKLALKKNKLTSLPDEIGNLTKLTDLYLKKNRLDMLPRSLSAITTLRLLDVSHNNVARKEFGFLGLNALPASSLTAFDLSYNKLEEIPQVTATLTCLQKLILTNNRLLELSCSIPLEIDLCNGQKLILETCISPHPEKHSIVYVPQPKEDAT